MQYFITFLEGIITFISPCLLPMLPVYISYFSGGEEDTKQTLKNSVGFVLGFSFVFILLGAFAGTFGRFLSNYRTLVNIITGCFVIILGLNFMGILNIGFLNQTKKLNYEHRTGAFTSFIFGVVFSIGWTPCVGAFLGSALLLASTQGSVVQGILMLVFYSIGLGIPFILSALIIDKLKGIFDFIKRHYRIINLISGGILVVVGIMMATGFWGYIFTLLSFSIG